MKPHPARVVIVHDFLNQYGGAERVVEAMHEIFPRAPVYTTIFDPRRMPAAFLGMDVRTSFLQRAPFVFRASRAYLPLYRRAVESLRLPACDVVLSSSSAFAKGVRVPAGAWHVCYCYNPMRFAWDTRRYLARERIPFPARAALAPILGGLRRWDRANSERVDRFLAISRVVADRIRSVYGRDAQVVHPPVRVDRWKALSRARASHAALDALLSRDGFPARGFDLVVSRLRAYKRVDLALDACAALEAPLLVIGDGEERGSLASRAGRNALFLGLQPDLVIAAAYARCRSVVFPGEEDFGLVPVEAMACGAPTVAYAAGGALETLSRATGVLFPHADVASLVAALRFRDRVRFDRAALLRAARRFDFAAFRARLRTALTVRK